MPPSSRLSRVLLLAAVFLHSLPSLDTQETDDAGMVSSSTSAMPLVGTFPTTPLAQAGDADVPAISTEDAVKPWSTGSTVVSTSSTRIDATTVVLLSSSSTLPPDAAAPAEANQEDVDPSPATPSSAAPVPSPSPLPATTRQEDDKTTPSPKPPPSRTTPTPATPPTVEATVNSSGAACDFGLHPTTTLCGWQALHVGRSPSSPKWRPGSGVATNWIGGPRSDSQPPPDQPPSGGYAFVETSEGAGTKGAGDRALLVSPQLPPSGVQGSCLQFMYSLAGLSARSLRVLVARNDSDKAKPELSALWSTTPPHVPGDAWLHGQILYSEPQPHRLILEASSTPAEEATRGYRGHVAVDAVSLVPGDQCPLPLACSFTAGICRWTNSQDDDFDWTMGRGSASTSTGPAAAADMWVGRREEDGVVADLRDLRDAAMEVGAASDHRPHPGGYVFVDSAVPRRPGDVARLESEVLPPSDPVFPNCLRFWYHMFGVDMGHLRVILVTDSGRRVVWSLTGDAGNAWFPGALTLAESHPYRVVVEASVGGVGMSDIAVDNISLDPGPCPVSPQVAGAPAMVVDCSMEVDECGWRVKTRNPRNDMQWSRLAVSTLPPTLQRKPQGGVGLKNDFFLGLRMLPLTGESIPAPATITSLPIASRAREGPLCLAFWYLVHEPTSRGLGALRVVLRQGERRDVLWAVHQGQGPVWTPARVPLVPLRVPDNASIIVELQAEWGTGKHPGVMAVDDLTLYTAKCPGVPASALSSPVDCSFTSDMCGWTERTSSPGWQHATGQHRPARLADNTFRAPGGYVFFDMFSLAKQPRRARLESATLGVGEPGEPFCLSFWFAAFGQGESTVLRVRRVDRDDRLPEITVWQLSAKGLDTARPQWIAGQATLSADSDFAVVLEGESSNGGFAVDDLRIGRGPCQTRPVSARPVST